MLVVYSASTIDIMDDWWQRGGPYRFIKDALRGFASVRLGCRVERSAVFEHREKNGQRASRLLRPPSRCRYVLTMGDAAVVSPVYWEISVEDAAALSRIGYRVFVVDLQGFSRLAGLRDRIESSAELVLHIANYIEEEAYHALVKASTEDIGSRMFSIRFLEEALYARVLTMGSRGACISVNGQCWYCRPRSGDPSLPAIGAGDVFSAFMALRALQETSLLDAVCEAVYHTERYLRKRAGLEDIPFPEGYPEARRLPCCKSCLAVAASGT